MLRAVPITVRIADSRLVVLRSTSLVFAISSTCFFVTFPTLLRFGSAEPFAIPAARSSSTDAGGVFKMNVNVRSVYTVTSTGKIIPSGSFAVLALNCLQKSMMFSPCGPRAVPTGGAGVAFAAGNCSFTTAFTFFAIEDYPCANPVLCDFLYLGEVEFHGRRAPENRHGNLQRATVGIHFLDHAGEIRERSFSDAHFFAALERQPRLGPFRRRGRAIENVLYFFFGERRRILPRSHEARNFRRRAHDVPRVIVHIHFDQHVAGIAHSRRDHFLA